MPPDKGSKRQKTINDALNKLADTLTDSESENEEISVGLADQTIDPIVPDDDPPPNSKRKRGPGKKKGNSPFKSSVILY